MSKNNRDGSYNLIALVGLVVVLAICVFLYVTYNPTAEDIPPVEPIVYSTAPASSGLEEESAVIVDDMGGTEPEEEPAEPAYEIPRGEWYLRLVNFDNLLEEDFAVDVVDIGRDFYFDARAAEDLLALLAGASEAGMPVRVVSASRSWENQQARYEERVDELMDEGLAEEEAMDQARRENMLPVASEHILSLGVDIVPEANQEQDETILDEPAYLWLLAHAHEYGFIQRYPTGRGDTTGIDFEPWHFRFVGVEHATRIYEGGLTLEEYLA